MVGLAGIYDGKVNNVWIRVGDIDLGNNKKRMVKMLFNIRIRINML